MFSFSAANFSERVGALSFGRQSSALAMCQSSPDVTPEVASTRCMSIACIILNSISCFAIATAVQAFLIIRWTELGLYALCLALGGLAGVIGASLGGSCCCAPKMAGEGRGKFGAATVCLSICIVLYALALIFAILGIVQVSALGEAIDNSGNDSFAAIGTIADWLKYSLYGALGVVTSETPQTVSLHPHARFAPHHFCSRLFHSVARPPTHPPSTIAHPPAHTRAQFGRSATSSFS